MTTERPNPRHPDADTSAPAWWQVRPDELAARFEWDVDDLMDAFNPEKFADEQADLALNAIACCRGELPALVVRSTRTSTRRCAPGSRSSQIRPTACFAGFSASTMASRTQRWGDDLPDRGCELARGSSLDRYGLPLLRALIEGGGSLPARDAVDAVGAALAADLASADQEQLQNGAPRWRDRVHHARLRLTAQGLIARDGPWGVWSITDEGRRSLVDGGPR